MMRAIVVSAAETDAEAHNRPWRANYDHVRRRHTNRCGVNDDRRGLHVSNIALLKTVLRRLEVRPDFVLSDGFHLPGMRLPHLSIKKGDVITASVAAASVVAKVTRDRMMDRYHRRYPQYGFDHHRGYGTPSHRAAIAQYGPSPIHRMSFKGMTFYAQNREAYVSLYGQNGGATPPGRERP